MPVAMTTFLRRTLASSILGALVFAVAGCGGGGGGVTYPTATPIGTPGPTTSGTASPTATTVPGTGGTRITANQIVFVSTRGGASDLYKANNDGSNVVRLTNLNQVIDKPSVSPDGTRIVFQVGDSNTNGGTNNIEIGIVNVNGSGFRTLTTDPSPAGRPDDYNPVWSGDGRYIYWTSTRSALGENGQIVNQVPQVPHIFRMSGLSGEEGTLEGSDQVGRGQVVREPSQYPSVDRTGNVLAYLATNRTATSPIGIRTISTGTTRYIGEGIGVGSVFDIALSPDANRVAFSVASGTIAGSPSSLRIYDANTGTRQSTVPTTSTSVGGAAWSRDSNTLYFDSAGGTTTRRQVFLSPSPFTTQTELTPNAPGDNYSPAFLSGP